MILISKESVQDRITSAGVAKTQFLANAYVDSGKEPNDDTIMTAWSKKQLAQMRCYAIQKMEHFNNLMFKMWDDSVAKDYITPAGKRAIRVAML